MRSRLSPLDISAFLFILLWGYTAISKIHEFDETLVQISQSPMIGEWAGFIAVILPIAELFLVVLLLMEKTKKTGLLLSLGMMTAFTTYIILMLNFSYHIPCACAGILSHGIIWKGEVVFKMTWERHIIFNLVFVIIGLANILFPHKPRPSIHSLSKLEMA